MTADTASGPNAGVKCVMARRPSPGTLPCLYCGELFPDSGALTTHLDVAHENWVKSVLTELGLSCSDQYPVEEYRRALAEAFLGGVPAQS